MAKGASSKDKKGSEKGKGKGKAEETADKGGKVRNILYPFFALLCVDRAKQGKGMKAATAINVRHILCEKHSKATEALQRIQVRSFNIWLRGHEAAVFFLLLYCIIFAPADLLWFIARAVRPGSDLTKSPRNVRRTRRKVSFLTCSVSLWSLIPKLNLFL